MIHDVLKTQNLGICLLPEHAANLAGKKKNQGMWAPSTVTGTAGTQSQITCRVTEGVIAPLLKAARCISL